MPSQTRSRVRANSWRFHIVRYTLFNELSSCIDKQSIHLLSKKSGHIRIDRVSRDKDGFICNHNLTNHLGKLQSLSLAPDDSDEKALILLKRSEEESDQYDEDDISVKGSFASESFISTKQRKVNQS